MKNSLNSISGFLKRLSYGPELRPTRDWLVLLVFTLLLIIASLGWNLWQFETVTSGESIGEATGPAEVAPVPLDEVRAVFERRAAEEARYRTEYRFVDPSR